MEFSIINQGLGLKVGETSLKRPLKKKMGPLDLRFFYIFFLMEGGREDRFLGEF